MLEAISKTSLTLALSRREREFPPLSLREKGRG
jgi:hypothetical protein